MDRRSLTTASIAALVAFLVWWIGVSYLDGILAQSFPYERYATIGLLYPEVFYPGIPGLALAGGISALGFGGWALWIGLLGWIVVLSAILGAGATWYAAERGGSPVRIAVTAVVGLFVAFTVMEAVGLGLA